MPAVTPVTTPVDDPTETMVEGQNHVPPVTVLLRVVLVPTQTVAVPDITPADGKGLTVTVAVAKQVAPVLYDIVTVPGAIHETVVAVPGVPETVAIAVLLLVHAPPTTVLLSVIVLPGHTTDGPDIADGTGCTDCKRVA